MRAGDVTPSTSCQLFAGSVAPRSERGPPHRRGNVSTVAKLVLLEPQNNLEGYKRLS
jgi:hypothetical protein